MLANNLVSAGISLTTLTSALFAAMSLTWDPTQLSSRKTANSQISGAGIQGERLQTIYLRAPLGNQLYLLAGVCQSLRRLSGSLFNELHVVFVSFPVKCCVNVWSWFKLGPGSLGKEFVLVLFPSGYRLRCLYTRVLILLPVSGISHASITLSKLAALN